MYVLRTVKRVEEDQRLANLLLNISSVPLFFLLLHSWIRDYVKRIIISY